MITVIMAEDHQMLIDGVTSFFEYNDEIKIIDTVNNGNDLIKKVRLKQPHVVITDIRMPKKDGIQATKIIKKEYPHIKVLALTMFDQPEAIQQMLNAGANGYLLKNSGIKMLNQAILKVSTNTPFFDPNVAYNFLNNFVKPQKNRSEKITLSNREKEILQLIANGLSSKDISTELFIAKTTVDTHRKNMIRKLNLSSGAELIKYAIDSKYKF